MTSRVAALFTFCVRFYSYNEQLRQRHGVILHVDLMDAVFLPKAWIFSVVVVAATGLHESCFCRCVASFFFVLVSTTLIKSTQNGHHPPPSLVHPTFLCRLPVAQRSQRTNMSGCKTAIKKVKDVSEATALVLDWFERENKPVTPQSLTDALGSRVAKMLLQKILDQLFTDKKLCVKDLKKVRFYYLRIAEETVENVDDGGEPILPSDLTAVQAEEDEVPEEAKASAAADERDMNAVADIGLAAASLAEKHRRLARWRAWPSRVELLAQQGALEGEVKQLEVEVAALKCRCSTDADTVQNAELRALRARRAVRRYRRARHLWAERRGWAMRLLEATGGDAHSPQDMAGLLGCTTDADAGVSFASTAVALPMQTLREIGLS